MLNAQVKEKPTERERMSKKVVSGRTPSRVKLLVEICLLHVVATESTVRSHGLFINQSVNRVAQNIGLCIKAQ